MNKSILLVSLLVTSAIFSAADSDHNQLINQFKQAVEQVTPETIESVLAQGGELPLPCKNKIASELWLLRFVYNRHINNQINDTNREKFMNLFPPRSLMWQALRSKNLNDLEQRIKEDNARIQHEENVARTRQELERLCALFNTIINNYHAGTCDQRTEIAKVIQQTAVDIFNLDKEAVSYLTSNPPFSELITALISENNIHALREIQQALPVPYMNQSTYDLIYSIVENHEDNPITSVTQVATSSQQPNLTPEEYKQQLFQYVQQNDEALNSFIRGFSDENLAITLRQMELNRDPEMAEFAINVITAIVTEQSQREADRQKQEALRESYLISQQADAHEASPMPICSSSATLHTPNTSTGDIPEQDLAQQEEPSPAAAQDEDEEDLARATALSLEPQPAQAEAMQIIQEVIPAQPAPTFWQRYRTPIIATAIAGSACAIGTYLYYTFYKK